MSFLIKNYFDDPLTQLRMDIKRNTENFPQYDRSRVLKKKLGKFFLLDILDLCALLTSNLKNTGVQKVQK